LTARRSVIVALFASALCAARLSRAEERAQLASDQRTSDANTCPDEAAFRQLVRDRVGREPFDPEAAARRAPTAHANGYCP
jgi:hypothetical protein